MGMQDGCIFIGVRVYSYAYLRSARLQGVKDGWSTIGVRIYEGSGFWRCGAIGEQGTYQEVPAVRGRVPQRSSVRQEALSRSLCGHSGAPRLAALPTGSGSGR